jgi:hypothetical protein
MGNSTSDFKYITEDIFKLVEEMNHMNKKVDEAIIRLDKDITDINV